MLNKRLVEILVGVFVSAAIGVTILIALKASSIHESSLSNRYVVHAYFDDIGSLMIRSPVRIAGVKIGEVTNISLDPKNFRAQVDLALDASNNMIPIDSSAGIMTEGLLGSKYIALSPGFDQNYLKNGDTITATHSAIILENLIGKFLFNS